MDGTGAVGTSASYARADHVHPSDTGKSDIGHDHAATDITSGILGVDYGGTGSTGFGTLKTVEGTNTSRASGSYIDYASVSLEAGLWVVFGSFVYGANANGARRSKLTTTSQDSTDHIEGQVTVAPAGNNTTIVQVFRVYSLTATTTVYAVGQQSSGSSINGRVTIRAIRIK